MAAMTVIVPITAVTQPKETIKSPEISPKHNPSVRCFQNWPIWSDQEKETDRRVFVSSSAEEVWKIT